MSFQQIQNTGVGSNPQSVGPLTPINSTDFLIATTSATGTTPAAGWVNTLATSFTWTMQVSNTTPVTWTGTLGSLGNTNPWGAVVMDFQTTGSVVLGAQAAPNFASGATQSVTLATNPGDTIIVAIPNTTPTTPFGSIAISDNKGNVYNAIANPINSFSSPANAYGQLWLFVAPVTVSGSTIITMTLSNWSALNAPNGSAYVLSHLAPIPPTVFLQAVPTSITLGKSSTLSWTVTGAQSATIDHGIGSVALSGSTVVTPAVTTTYTLSGITNGVTTGTATATVQVTVNNATFNLQKLILWLKEASVPVRGRNQ